MRFSAYVSHLSGISRPTSVTPQSFKRGRH